MAEFCKECATKYGMQNDEPCFCEDCKKHVEEKKTDSQTVKKLLTNVLFVVSVVLIPFLLLKSCVV